MGKVEVVPLDPHAGKDDNLAIAATIRGRRLRLLSAQGTELEYRTHAAPARSKLHPVERI